MSAKARLAAVIALLSLVPLQGAAQGLTGLVYSTEDRAPVAGATVRLLDADLMITDTATTDQLGRFTISRPPSGAWVLVASHAGFLGSPHQEIDLDAADAGVSFMLGLTPLPLERAEEVVTAERQAVRPAVVTGTVVDRSTGGPLTDVEVRLVGSEKAVLSRWDGRFVLGEVDVGRVTLQVSRLGHVVREHTFEAEPGLAYDIRVPLDQVAIPLEGVTVTVRPRMVARMLEPVYERMNRGLGGYFLDREDLEKRGLATVAEAIQGLPSVRVCGRWTRPRVVIRGGGCRRGCSPVIYVDGMRVGKDDAAAEFLSMSAADIEVVEVFTGPATIPPEYGTADYCAVGIWTKRGR